jgi:hypothetical protein
MFPGWWVRMVSSWLALAFFIVRQVHPNSFIFTRWNLPMPETGCLRLYPSEGMPEVP